MIRGILLISILALSGCDNAKDPAEAEFLGKTETSEVECFGWCLYTQTDSEGGTKIKRMRPGG